MLDMATTTVAFGKIEVAARRGGTMPTGWAVDGTGTDTTDAVTVADTGRGNKSPYGGLLFLGGATETLGGHKGYGLGLLVELLTSGLSMGTASFDIPSSPAWPAAGGAEKSAGSRRLLS